MGILSALESGRLGARWTPPSHWRVDSDARAGAAMVDTRTRNSWWAFAFEDLHMDISVGGLEELRARASHHAHEIFVQSYAQDKATDLQPRTDDKSWSALIDLDRCDFQSTPALRITHRSIYRMGLEVILGHLLIPREWGLLEFRLGTANTMTGFRESAILMMNAGPQGDLDATMKACSQATYDDPAHDENFPKHCLSQNRAELRWLMESSGLALGTSPSPQPVGRLRALGATLMPPAGFFLTSQDAWLRRVSLCGSDGVQSLVLRREHFPKRTQQTFSQNAVAAARKALAEDGLTNFEVHATEQEQLPRRELLFVIDADGHRGRMRTGVRTIQSPAGRVWSIMLVTSIFVPLEFIIDELAGTVLLLDAP